MASVLKLMSTDDNICWLSASQIAILGKEEIIKMPGSERRAGESARKLGWLNRQVRGKGGRGGKRTEFQPPNDVLEVIQSFLKENPDFFTKAKGEAKDKPHSKPYPVSKATALTLKSPEPAHIVTVIDTQTMIFVMVSVDSLITKKGINIDPVKKAELILLIYDYCKGTGMCNEDIVAKFLKLAG